MNYKYLITTCFGAALCFFLTGCSEVMTTLDRSGDSTTYGIVPWLTPLIIVAGLIFSTLGLIVYGISKKMKYKNTISLHNIAKTRLYMSSVSLMMTGPVIWIVYLPFALNRVTVDSRHFTYSGSITNLWFPVDVPFSDVKEISTIVVPPSKYCIMYVLKSGSSHTFDASNEGVPGAIKQAWDKVQKNSADAVLVDVNRASFRIEGCNNAKGLTDLAKAVAALGGVKYVHVANVKPNRAVVIYDSKIANFQKITSRIELLWKVKFQDVEDKNLGLIPSGQALKAVLHQVEFRVEEFSDSKQLPTLVSDLEKLGGVKYAEISGNDPNWAIVIYDANKTSTEEVTEALKSPNDKIKIVDFEDKSIDALPKTLHAGFGKPSAETIHGVNGSAMPICAESSAAYTGEAPGKPTLLFFGGYSSPENFRQAKYVVQLYKKLPPGTFRLVNIYINFPARDENTGKLVETYYKNTKDLLLEVLLDKEGNQVWFKAGAADIAVIEEELGKLTK